MQSISVTYCLTKKLESNLDQQQRKTSSSRCKAAAVRRFPGYGDIALPNKMKKETYKVEMDMETMHAFRHLVQFSLSKFPFTKECLWRFSDKLSKIIQSGCWKHNILTEQFRTGTNSTEAVCPRCYPKRYKESKKEYGGKKW